MTDIIPLNSLPALTHNGTDITPQFIQRAVRDGRLDSSSPQFKSYIDYLLHEFKIREPLAKNSLKALDLGWKDFVDWCVTENRVSLPASSSTVEAYLHDKMKVLRRNTLRVRRWAIGKVHKICGYENPFNDEWVQMTVSGINKSDEKRGEIIEQASAFNERHLERLESLYFNGTMREQRDLMLMTVAYESLLRSQEVASIKLRHIKPVDNVLEITIPVTKTNHSGEPDVVALSEPASLLVLDYLKANNLKLTDDGYLFRRLRRDGRVYPKTIKPMSNQGVIDIYNRVWVSLGGYEDLNVKPFTSHSCRVGAAQDLLAAGYSVLQVQQAGRWSEPTMVFRYGRGILARQSAMSHYRARRK